VIQRTTISPNRNDAIEMNDAFMYVGKVREVKSSYGAYHYALVDPLLRSDADRSEWAGGVSDAFREFPNRGRAFWHNASPNLGRGSIWQFAIEPKPPGAHAETGQDAWQVVDPQAPIEIVDVQSWDEDELRLALTGSGLSIYPTPLLRRVAFWIDPDHLLGPVRIALADDQRSWVLVSEDLAKLPLWRTPHENICEVDLDGPRFLLGPSLDFGPSAGILDWSADDVVATNLIQRIRQHNKLAAEALSVTEPVFAKYVEVLRQTGFVSRDGALDRVRVGRIAALCRAIEHDRDLIEQATSALLQSRAVSERVDKLVEDAVATEVARRSNEIEKTIATLALARETVAGEIYQLEQRRSELEASIVDCRRRLAESEETLESRLSDENVQLLQRRGEVEAGIAVLEERLASLEVELRTRATEFEQAFAEHLRELAASPARALADLAFARAILSARPDGGSVNSDGSVDASSGTRPVPSIAALPENLPVVASLKHLQAVLAIRSSHRGAEFQRALELHVACLAGAFPLVHGDGAEDLVQSYAATIAGGRVLWVPIGASAIEPDRILGTADVASRRFIPDANGLVELLVAAEHSSDVHVLVFEGCNRAPVDGWLFPLLHAMEAERVGMTDRGVPLVPRGSLDRNDPFADVERLRWPVNVIPIGIPTQGTSTLPLPTETWRFGALICVEGTPRPGSRKDPVPPSRVEAGKWMEWVRQVIESDAPDMVAAQRVLAQLPAGPRHLDVAARMLCALKCHEMDDAKARPHALIPTLVPRFVEHEDTLRRCSQELGIGSPSDWSTVLDVGRRLSE
jgi:hypothetical protein